MYLADTNIVSELMRPRPAGGVSEWMATLEHQRIDLVISAITVDEIVFGLRWRPHPAKTAWFVRFMQRATVLPTTEIISRRAGEMRAQLALAAQVRAQTDMLIAATAQLHALTLVTRNVHDFDGCGIAVLNPFTP